MNAAHPTAPENALAGGGAAQRRTRRIALLAFAIGVFAYRDSIMDDTFIHLQYARNLRVAGEIAFNSGEPSLGATSPLWMLLLAALGAVEPAARLLSVACGALSVFVFARIARRVLGSGTWATAATVAWAGSLWLVRHAPNGMESTGATLAVLAAVELRSRGGRHTGRDALFGAVVAAAVLLRPEASIYAAIVLVQDLRHAWGRARLATWLPVALLPLVAWAWFAHDRTGSILPATGGAKSGGFVAEPLRWLRVVWNEARVVGAAHAVELLGLALALGLGLHSNRRALWRALATHALTPYALFAVVLAAAYALFDLQIQPRYLLPVLPCVVMAGFGAWQRVLGPRTRAAVVVAAASLLVGAVSGVRAVHPATHGFATGLRTVLVPMAHDIAARDLDPKVVASPDIGVLGYHSGARMLDLGGLVDRRVQALVDSVGYDAMLEQGLFFALGRPDFVVDRSPEPERFAGHQTHGLVWRPLRTGAVRGLGISRPRTFYYTLYALEPPSAFGHRTPPRATFDRVAANR